MDRNLFDLYQIALVLRLIQFLVEKPTQIELDKHKISRLIRVQI